MKNHLNVFTSSLTFACKDFFKHPWFWWKAYVGTVLSIVFGFVLPGIYLAITGSFFISGAPRLQAQNVPLLLVYILSLLIVLVFLWLVFRSVRHMARIYMRWLMVALHAAQGQAVHQQSLHDMPAITNKKLLLLVGYSTLSMVFFGLFSLAVYVGMPSIFKMMSISYHCEGSLFSLSCFSATPFEPLWYINILMTLVLIWILGRVYYGMYFLLEGTDSLLSALKKSMVLTQSQWSLIFIFASYWYGSRLISWYIKEFLQEQAVIMIIGLSVLAWIEFVIGSLMIARSYVLMKK